MTIVHEYLYQQEKYAKKYGIDKTIVFMEIGTFYESYATDTRGFNLKELSEVMNLTRTRKNKKNATKVSTEKSPYLLGFPSVSYEKYLKILINNGYTAVIYKQTPPPQCKHVFVGIFSPGTYIDNTFTPDSNYIISLYIEDEKQKDGSFIICIGMAAIDLSTGTSIVYEVISKIDDDTMAADEAVRFINSYNPKEVIVYRKRIIKTERTDKYIPKDKLISYLELEGKNYSYHEKIEKKWYKLSYQNSFFEKVYPDIGMFNSPLEFLELERKYYAALSFLLLIQYAYEHQVNIIEKLDVPEIFIADDYLILGNNALFQLNVINYSNMDYNNKRFKSLFDVINKTSTAIGRRYLKKILIAPFVDTKKLTQKYNYIEEICKKDNRDVINKFVSDVIDIERLHRKIALKSIHPFEFKSFISSLECIQQLIKVIKKNKILKSMLPSIKIRKSLNKFLVHVNEQYNMDRLEMYTINAIENNIFNKGKYKKLDKIQDDINDCRDFMGNICDVLSSHVNDVGKAKFKQRIVNIVDNTTDNKIKLLSNKIDGYYLSLTKLRAKSLKSNLPNKVKITDKYTLNSKNLIFKQLSKGNTKIFFPELNTRSDKLITLYENIKTSVFDEYIKRLEVYQEKYGFMFRKIVEFVGLIDFLQSSALVAKLYNYTKPEIIKKDKGYIKCKQLRHPIIERINIDTSYVPHDIEIGTNDLDGMLIFGVNSSGKSALMKAIGLSVILAQIGMFVPATKYEFSPYNSLFARITGNDNIFKGLSSFALEMTELKAILRRVGPKTLVIGDEVCRGTEHISGNSIVTATLVNLSESKSTFLFATHLHEIPTIDEIKNLKNVKAFHLTVEHDTESDILIFDRKLKPGSGESIYGITIAKYIIDDPKFISLAINIRNRLLNKPSELLVDKKSKYNINLYMDKCAVCCKTFSNKKDCVGYLDTHHINHQKDCKDGFVINKPHIPMNSKANLVPLCKLCHYKVHHDKLEIYGYKKTSGGIKLQYNEK
jgi:DNA mismatch repair protein MutS